MGNEDLPDGNVKLGGEGEEANVEGGDISEREFLIWIMREKIVWRTVSDKVVILQWGSPSV